MARRRRSRTRIIRPRKQRMRSLPAKPGTTIRFINPTLAILVERKARRRGEKPKAGGEQPKIRVCKCLQTDFVCAKEGDVMVCREQCKSWECEDVEVGK
jgi:hypothetical protein